MLELQKKQIHMSRSKNTVSAQVTFDEDFNIPDAKPDVGSVLLKQADAVLSTQESFISVPCLARNFLLHQHSLRRQQDRFQEKKISQYLEKIWKWCLCSCKKRIRFVWRMM